MGNRVLCYDFKNLPEVPFSMYFYNDGGEISPKKIFTVTNKVINHKKNQIDLFITELKRDITYDPKHVRKVACCEPN